MELRLKVDMVAHNSMNSEVQKVYKRCRTCNNMNWVQVS
jgi:hypothetical protein